MAGFADRLVDLEIELGQAADGAWTAVTSWTRPGEDVESYRRAVAGPRLDLAALRGLLYDRTSYGGLLTASVFGVKEVRDAFVGARTVAETENVPLRLRLLIDPEATELHAIAWETLRHPDREDIPLLLDGRVLFSRHLRSQHWQGLGERSKARLRAVVAIANPRGRELYRVGEGGRAPIRVEEELARARQGLSAFRIAELASGGSATLRGLAEALHESTDIVLLVCHGNFTREDRPKPVLFLEKPDGTDDAVLGSELVQRLAQLPTLPSLVVLASCQSAGDDSGDAGERALSALGPSLAAEGVPAVLAMQGSVTMPTMARFLPAFFRELQRHGLVDQAVAVARREVQDRQDWWMPVLFLRLRSGRIWSDLDRFGKWPALLRQVKEGRCTPILGPGLTDTLLPSRQEIAVRWARDHKVPMSAPEHEDLAHVAQYLAITQNVAFPGGTLIDEFRAALLERSDPAAGLDGGDLEQLVRHVAQRRRAADPAEPHRVLAELRLPLYLTTHPAGFLEAALADLGTPPAVGWCRWKDDVDVQWPAGDVYQIDPEHKPDREHPTVYHLFGSLGDPSSLVLTEDDCLDYLIAVSSPKELLPLPVRASLNKSALLLLGFRMEDMDFRGLLRVILSQEGRAQLNKFTHVAVQIDPDRSRTPNPEALHKYIDDYFQTAGQNLRIVVYWGSAEEFLEELWRRLQQTGP